ncbi:Protein-tyrosine kinase [Candidatus Koribacter versatilis Ellin345]|uniref:non-specific protein-tyrosine kinase n=1 Tax=Koribacter versatilis (strain Ellin345) TaxID=204669 RepID=Q1ING6_KORVE|nr:polysaccharide biosynthesis tyrosine autokinase [Candidatus Koribacter versatilis]ABF41584.1 Protein-tyrosine kinase [Candidatus Koribacter versatilis Ellin345]
MSPSHSEPPFGRLHSSNDEFSLLALSRVLSARRRTVGYITGAGIAIAILISLFSPTKFAATATLELNPANATSFNLSSGASSSDHVEAAVNQATQVGILQSDELALQVITKLKLEEVADRRSFFKFGRTDDRSVPLNQTPARTGRMLRSFHQNLRVQPVGGTRLIEIRYLDRDPALTAAVVNALVDDYLDRHVQTRFTATRQASDWLSRQLTDLKNDVETSQQRLADYQRETGILGESETNNIVTAKLEDINKQLSAAEANRIVKEAVWRLAKSGDPELISSMAGTSLVPGIASSSAPLGLLPTLRAQEAQLKADIAQNSERLGPSFPKLVQMRAQLADLQSSIQSELGKISARAENDYLAAKNAEDMERALFAKQKQEANQINDSAVQYGVLKREADANRDLYQTLLGKLKEAGVLAGLHSSDILVVDSARVPDKPASPKRLLNLVLGAVIGLILGVSIALLQDSLDRTIRSPEDVARVSNIPTIGVIPVHSDDDKSEADQRFRALRGNLPAGSPRVTVVSGPAPGEGKTTVAIHLAQSLGRLGRRVLLVDADLHRPSVHKYLKLDNSSAGLSELLTDSHLLSGDSRTLPDGIALLLAGTATEQAIDHVESPRMGALIDHWRSTYDDIVIDTPPVLAYSNAVSISKFADAVLLVLRAGQTSSDALVRSLEIFEQSGVKVSGAVLNRLDFHSPYYKHYYGNDYRSLQEPTS